MAFSLPDPSTIGSTVFQVLAYYIGITTVLAAAVAVRQEANIWKADALPSLSLFGAVKVFLFNVVWMILCLVGSLLIVVKYILSVGRSDIEAEANRLVENTVARVCVALFVGSVSVVGQELLPKGDDNSCTTAPAPVYIANHASQIDVAVVYYAVRTRFKWIAKQSVLFLPGVGQVMALGQHVLIQRKGKNKKSVGNLFEKSNASVQAGVPMFFFPQGTRRIADKLPFKGTTNRNAHGQTHTRYFVSHVIIHFFT